MNAFAGPTLVSQDRASLISRFAASARVRHEIPLPADASVFRIGQVVAVPDTAKPIDPSFRQTCLGLQLALTKGHRLVVLTGSSKSALSNTLEAALQSLGYRNVYHGPINSARAILEGFSDQSTDSGETLERQIIVVEDAHALSAASLQTLVQLAEAPEPPSVQVLLAGRPELSGKLKERQYRASVGKVVGVELKPEVDIKPQSKVEFDLARAWKGAEAAKQREHDPRNGAAPVVSPFPALAALLNQSAPSRSVARRNTLIISVVVLGLGLCSGLVGTNENLRSHLTVWVNAVLN